MELYKKILHLMFESVASEGGDGDAIWLIRYTSLESIKELIKNYDKENNINWEIKDYGNHLNWGNPRGEEWLTITDSEDFYDGTRKQYILGIRY